MLVKFIKDCLVEFPDKRVVRYEKGTLDELQDDVAAPLLSQKIVVSDAPQLSGDRFDFYKKRFSLPELKEFCKEKSIPLKTAEHRTIPIIIEQILAYEEEHGLLLEVSNE